MPTNIKATNMTLTDALRGYVEDKLSQLDRHAADNPINIDVELEHMTNHHSGPIFRCEIMYSMPGANVIRGESTEADMYAAIDTCIPKVKQQLDHASDKRETRIKQGGRTFKDMMRKLWD